METLFANENHRNIWLEDFGHGLAVQANQHLIIHNGKALILDPGGHKAYKETISQVAGLVPMGDLRYIFLSHQDPDVVAAVNGWLMTTDAIAYCSEIWVRFVPHFGLDKLVQDRLKGIPDRGMILNLEGCDLMLLPAHFLHSSGNFHIYDPISKILYSGDLGASLGMDYQFVQNFAEHLPYMEGFHRRYMATGQAMKAWVHMVRDLDIAAIVPQHGAAFRGKELVDAFLNWCEQLECGIDIMKDIYRLPTAPERCP